MSVPTDPDDLDFGATLKGLRPELRMFDRYTLSRQLGRGGMGVVWLGYDERLHREVALKFLPEMVQGDAVALDELREETNRSLALTHPHIVRIHDLVEEQGAAAIVMEYVSGLTLSELRLSQPGKVFEVPEISAWIEQLCAALTYAHGEKKIVHRDLKPSNLMIDGQGRLRVMDFGIAGSLTDSMSRLSAAAMPASGTLVYMSPQQAMGYPPSVADDIYSLGATIYELLTGKPPFYRGNIQHQIETVVPCSIAERREQLGVEGTDLIPDSWEKTVAGCLAKDSKERPSSATEVWARLNGAATAKTYRPVPLPGPTSAPRRKPDPTGSPAQPAQRRKPGSVGWGTIAVVVVISMLAVASGIGWVVQNGRGKEEPRTAAPGLSEKAPEATAEGTETRPQSESGVIAAPSAPQSPPPVAQPVVVVQVPTGPLLVMPTQIARVKSTTTTTSVDDSGVSKSSTQTNVFYSPRQCGFMDLKGRNVLAPQWEFAGAFRDGLANVRQGGKWGAIDTRGRVVVPLEWDEGFSFKDGVAPVKRGGKWGLVNSSGMTISAPQWDDRPWAEDGFYTVDRDGKYGLLDSKGNILTAAQWDEPLNFEGSLAEIKRDSLSGCIDRTGKVIAEPVWDYLSVQENGTMIVERGSKYGLLGANGQVLNEPQWDDMSSAEDGLIQVKRGDDYSFIDAEGTLILPFGNGYPQYREGLICFQEGDKVGYADAQGKTVIQPQFEGGGPFSEGLAAVRISSAGAGYIINNAGYINKYGSMVIEAKWYLTFDFEGGLGKVMLNNKQGIIDRSGAIVSQPQWDSIYIGDDGYPIVERGERKGALDPTGRQVVDVEWDEVSCRGGKYFEVERDGKTGILDIQGRTITDAQWDELSSTNESCTLFAVERDGKYGLLDREGKVLLDTEWDSISFDDDNDIIQVSRDDKNGMFDRSSGKVSLFDQSPYFGKRSEAWARRDGKWGLTDRKGNFLIPAEWDSVGYYEPEKDGPVYRYAIKTVGTDRALMVWLAPDLKEIWHAEMPLVDEIK